MEDRNDSFLEEERPNHSKATSLRLIKQLMKQKKKLMIMLGSIIISSLLSVIAPMLSGEAINTIFAGVQKASSAGEIFQLTISSVGVLMFTILLVYSLSTLFSYVQQHIMASVSQKLTLSLRKEVCEKLNRLPLRFYDQHKKGAILSKLTIDMEKIADTLQEGLSQLFSSAIGILGSFFMMLYISPSLTLIASVSIVVSFLAAGLFSKKTQTSVAEHQEALSQLNASIEESFSGNLEIKAFNREQKVIAATADLNERLLVTGRKSQFIINAIMPLIRLFGQMGYVLVAIRGAFFVISGQIGIGTIQAFFQYVNQVNEPLTQFTYVINALQGAIAAAERVYQMIDEIEEQPDLVPSQTIDTIQGNVSFEHVRFGYQEDAILMEDVNFQIKAGSKIAIVGPTGAGKTTLVNLLMRFYELQSGRITIDGVDIAKMKRSYLRSLFGMVLQDTWLFHGTIEDNIAYSSFRPAIGDILDAGKAARINHFVKTLPQGYQTILDDEAGNLSQGQKQLITIARAILADPVILILDEATSSVDTRTEIEIQKAMNHLMEGRTSFIIAHRLSTIRDADLILVMKEGTIVEQGTHEELLQLDQAYASLYHAQFATGLSA